MVLVHHFASMVVEEDGDGCYLHVLVVAGKVLAP